MINNLRSFFTGLAGTASGLSYRKSVRSALMYRFPSLLLLICAFGALPLRAESQSLHDSASTVVTKAQSSDLLLNELMPTFSKTRVQQVPDCIPAKSEQVEIWKFVGFKARSETIQQKIGPDVGCVVTVSVHREGITEISASENSATISFPLIVNMTTATEGGFGGAFELSEFSQASIEMTLHSDGDDVGSPGMYQLTWLGPDKAYLPNGDAVDFIDSAEFEQELYNVDSGELVRASMQDISDLAETTVDDVE